jgi:hypothetical protein
MDANDNEPPGGTEPGRLYRIDMTTHQWTHTRTTSRSSGRATWRSFTTRS